MNAPHSPSGRHGHDGHTTDFDHVLIVGGTGMLADATEWCVMHARMTTIVSRHANAFVTAKLSSLAERANPLALDYRHDEVLCERIRDALATHGPPDLVVTWIHSSAPNAFETIAREVAASASAARRTGPIDVIRVLSSAYADPSRGAHLAPPILSANPQLRGHVVVLGFVLDGPPDDPAAPSRWLTNLEISLGVVAAIERARSEPYGAHHELDTVPITVPVSIVGTVEPWNRRP